MTPRAYNIIVDVEGNGIYDAGFDAIDTNDLVSTAGFFVIPTVYMGTITALAVCLTGLGLYGTIKHRKQEKP